MAPNTFRRIVTKYELVKADSEASNKRRLAFAKAHANELWQAVVAGFAQGAGAFEVSTVLADGSFKAVGVL